MSESDLVIAMTPRRKQVLDGSDDEREHESDTSPPLAKLARYTPSANLMPASADKLAAQTRLRAYQAQRAVRLNAEKQRRVEVAEAWIEEHWADITTKINVAASEGKRNAYIQTEMESVMLETLRYVIAQAHPDFVFDIPNRYRTHLCVSGW